jgi:hypothetical protein
MKSKNLFSQLKSARTELTKFLRDVRRGILKADIV